MTQSLLGTGWRPTSLDSEDVVSFQQHGREYLRFPLTVLAEGTLAYPERGVTEFLPAEAIRETADLWDGVPLTVEHPDNRSRTAADPQEFIQNVVGAAYNPTIVGDDDTLRLDGLVDVQKAEGIGGGAKQLVDDLRAGKTVQVSAGYATMDERESPGVYDGTEYTIKQGPPLPDHVAVFSESADVQARCTPEDGCAAPRANYRQRDEAQRILVNAVCDCDTMSTTNANDERLRAELESVKRRAREVLDGDTSDALTPTDMHEPVSGEEVRAVKERVAEALDTKRVDPARNGKRANMAGAPGRFNRQPQESPQRENPGEYPAGGRSAWERRKAGFSQQQPGVQEDEGLMTRSAWEKRQRRLNGQETEEYEDVPTGTRSSYEARQNAETVDERDPEDIDGSEFPDAEYPLTRARQERQRLRREQRWNSLREEAQRLANRQQLERE